MKVFKKYPILVPARHKKSIKKIHHPRPVLYVQ
jgi:hypothetical protein